MVLSQHLARPCGSVTAGSHVGLNMTMMITMVMIFVSSDCSKFCYGWSSTRPIHFGYYQRLSMIGKGTSTTTSLFSTRRVKKTTVKKKEIATNTEGFVDVDFERVVVEEEEEDLDETQELAVAQPVQPKQPKKKPPLEQEASKSTSSKKSSSSTTTASGGGDGGTTTTSKDSTTPPPTTTKTLIDISLETGDPNWNKARIPFFHPNGQNYIDCKLAFMVDIESDDGSKVSYGIAVPFDHAVAIVEEHPKKGNVMYFHPDDVVAAGRREGGSGSGRRSSNSNNDDNDDVSNRSGVDSDEILELMEIMATHVHEQLGDTLTLCKTPKVLTIRGEGLKELTENWETELLPSPATVEELLSTMSSSSKSKEKPTTKKQQQQPTNTSKTSKPSKDDIYQEELQEFYDFMKAELGQAEFDKTMNQELNEDDIDEELLKLFDVPGLDILDKLGDDDDGSATTSEGMEEILQSMLLDIQEQTNADENKEESKGLKSPQEKKKRSRTTTLEKESEFITKPTFMDGAALKLLSFNFRGGKKAYSLVKLLQPFVIVGKYVGEMTDEHIVADDDDDDDNYDLDDYYDYEADDDDDDGEDESSNAQASSSDDATTQQKKKPRMIRFELLTPEEEKVVIPKLDELCRNDLEAAGLSTLQP